MPKLTNDSPDPIVADEYGMINRQQMQLNSFAGPLERQDEYAYNNADINRGNDLQRSYTGRSGRDAHDTRESYSVVNFNSFNPQTDRGAGTDSRTTELAAPNVRDQEEIIDTGGEEDRSEEERAIDDEEDELPQQMEF